jgi:flagellar assembly factor FliW
MNTLMIQGTEVPYDEKDIITFPEGLIGLPHLRKMVVIRQSAIEPLLWLVSVDEKPTAFLVADAPALFPGYSPQVPVSENPGDETLSGEVPVVLGIVLISPEWKESTVNLRAPLFISARTMKGVQLVLPDHSLSVGERLPLAQAA